MDDEIELVTNERVQLSPSDRQMVRAMTTIESARTGVVVLRVIAAVVVGVAVLGQGLGIFGADDGFSAAGFSGRQQWASFLAGISVPIAFGGLVVAASYLLDVYASRLDMDIVLAEMDEPDED